MKQFILRRLGYSLISLFLLSLTTAIRHFPFNFTSS